MTPQSTKTMLEAYGLAASQLAIAAERFRTCSNKPTLIAKSRLLELEALAAYEGEFIVPQDLALEHGFSARAWKTWPFTFVQMFDRPFKGDVYRPTAQDIMAWFAHANEDAVRASDRPKIEIYTDRLEAWASHVRGQSETGRILQGVRIASSFAKFAPLSSANIAVGLMLGDRVSTGHPDLSGGGVIAIGLRSQTIPWVRIAAGADDELDPDFYGTSNLDHAHSIWLKAAAGGGQTLARLASRVDRWQEKVTAACATKRSTSRLARVCELAGTHMSLTSGRLANLMKVSRQGATTMLEEAREEGLLYEVTHGNSFRRYIASI